MHFPILSSCAERGDERGGEGRRVWQRRGEKKRREERRGKQRRSKGRGGYNKTVGGIIQNLIADGALCRVTETEFK